MDQRRPEQASLRGQRRVVSKGGPLKQGVRRPSNQQKRRNSVGKKRENVLGLRDNCPPELASSAVSLFCDQLAISFLGGYEKGGITDPVVESILPLFALELPTVEAIVSLNKLDEFRVFLRSRYCGVVPVDLEWLSDQVVDFQFLCICRNF